jgi:HlyD family secretion protein
VEPSAFTKVSALGIEEQRVWVIADIVAPPAQWSTLGDGFRVETRIVTWEAAEVLKVPAGAIFRQQDDWAVYVARRSQACLQSVRVGHTNGLETEILDGLTADDQVILHPSDRVHPGSRIVTR